MTAPSTPLLLVLDPTQAPADLVDATRGAAGALAEEGLVRLQEVRLQEVRAGESSLPDVESFAVVHAVGPRALSTAQRALRGHAYPALVATAAPAAPRRGLSVLRSAMERRNVDRWAVHGARGAARLVEHGIPGHAVEALPLLPVVAAAAPEEWEDRRRAARSALGVLPGGDVVVGVGPAETEAAFLAALRHCPTGAHLGLWLDLDARRGWTARDGQVRALRVDDPTILLPAMDVLVSLGRSSRARSAVVDAWRAGVPLVATSDDDGAVLAGRRHPTVLLRRADPRQAAAAITSLTATNPVSRRRPAQRTWHRVEDGSAPLARALLACYRAALGAPLPVMTAGAAS